MICKLFGFAVRCLVFIFFRNVQRLQPEVLYSVDFSISFELFSTFAFLVYIGFGPIQAGWLKWRRASGVLWDTKAPLKLKEFFYHRIIRRAMLYKTQCWTVKNQHENKISKAKIRMLHQIAAIAMQNLNKPLLFRDTLYSTMCCQIAAIAVL